MRAHTIHDTTDHHARVHAGYASDQVDLFVQAVQDAVRSHLRDERDQRLEGP